MINIDFNNDEKLELPDNSPEYIRTNGFPSNITIYSTGKNNMSLKDIEKYDTDNNKLTFSGHFYIRTDGSIYRGRPEDCIGEFAYDFNNKYNLNFNNLGVCLEGNFNEDFLQDIQKSTLYILLDFLRDKYPNIKISYLREFDHKDNPGLLFPFNEVTAYYDQSFESDYALIGDLEFITFGSRELIYNSLELMYGTDIYTLQVILSKLGFYEEKPNGIYDDYTKVAVMRYQRSRNLVDSGITGYKTIDRLKEDIKKIYSTQIFNRVISIESGDEYLNGKDVLRIQKELNKKSYYCKETGIFDEDTSDMVYKFQMNNNIKADGKVGPITWSLLFSDSVSNFRILKLDFNSIMYGNDVKLLQERLVELGYRLPITEKFDLLTETQVRSYQIKNNLQATGVVDKNLWDKIFSN